MKLLETNYSTSTALVYVALRAGALLMTFPFIWMMFTSFKSVGESVQIPSTTLSKQWMKEDYLRAIVPLPIVKLRVNTALLILFRVFCAVAFPSTAGFTFAKLKFRGKNLLLSLVIVQMMPLSQIFITPQYQMSAGMGLISSMFVLISPGLVNTFGTFLLRQAYMGIPDELGEAAYLDDCTRWQIPTRVMMSLTKISMAALTIFTAVFVYAGLMQPLIANTGLNIVTLSAGLPILRRRFITNYPVLMAGSVLAMVPMVILYLVLQKQFTKGIAMTDGKQKMEIKTGIEAGRGRYIQTEDDIW